MVEDRQRREVVKHQILMISRQYVEVTGVTGVESFDVNEFILQTTNGLLSIRGDNLHIKALNLENGLVSIEGRIDDLEYLEDSHAEKRGKRFWGRLLK